MEALTALTAMPFLAHSDHSSPVTLSSACGSTVSPPSSGVDLTCVEIQTTNLKKKNLACYTK